VDPIVEDLLVPGLEVVFCGTALSAVSAERRAYYAHPGNRFWRILHVAGLTPRQLEPEEFRRLLEFGIGLTDVAKHASGQDADLSSGDFDPGALHARIGRAAPRRIAFTSKRAALEGAGLRCDYGVQPDRFAGVEVWVLPSTSGLAVKFWDEKPWRDLATAVSAGRAGARTT
jgi:TDG/mug DNA glycosylase family protein